MFREHTDPSFSRVHMRWAYRFARRVVLVAIALTVAWDAAAAPLVFRANGDARDQITFYSSAPMEEFAGRDGVVRAEVFVASLDDIVNETTAAVFEVDLTTMRTGIALRDRHMRERYLETAKYPKAVFTLDRIEEASTTSREANGSEARRSVRGLAPNTPTQVIATGTLELHGVRKKIRVEELTLTYLPESDATQDLRPGDVLRVQGKFEIKLSDFNIKRPQLMFLRIAEEVRIEIDVTLGTGVTGIELLDIEKLVTRNGGKG